MVACPRLLPLLAVALLLPFPGAAAQGNGTAGDGANATGDAPGERTRATGLSSVLWLPLLLGVVALVVVLVALAYRGLP